MVIRSLKLLGWLMGVSLIGIGVSRLAFSTQAIPAGGTVNPTVDSESRAAGPLLMAFGVSYIWAFRHSPVPSATLRLLAATMALLGVARLISMAESGMPHVVFTVATVIEFAVAGLTYWYSTMSDQPAANGVPDGRRR
jgi:hypothetical protein